MGYSPICFAKTGNVQRPIVKRPNLGHQLVEEDLGWSLLELISRRPGRRRNEDGNERQATRSLMGMLLLPPRLATLEDLQASLPRATFSPSMIPPRSIAELKKDELPPSQPPQPVFAALIFRPLIQTQVRRGRESRDSKVKESKGSTVLLGKINF